MSPPFKRATVLAGADFANEDDADFEDLFYDDISGAALPIELVRK